ncbi:uncharacterized protein TNCV_532581 [Trichonephila clavipes]|nr:uncharacterized protein TNCV_532581 [Trichonephila clavipes]
MVIRNAVLVSQRFSPITSNREDRFQVCYDPWFTFIRDLRNPSFQQDNAQLHTAGIVQTYLDTENVHCLSCPAHSPELSPIKKLNPWLPSDWLVPICQLLQLMSCDIVLKLHRHLYLYMPPNLCLTQCPGRAGLREGQDGPMPGAATLGGGKLAVKLTSL